jgi:hypothetical protein
MSREENLKAGAKLLAVAHHYATEGDETKAIRRCLVAIQVIRVAGRQRLQEEGRK